jgi:catechol 2,3-dioxygenase-like lactoylglutathione lyase family enzyme
MLDTATITAFLATAAPERAKSFYQETLGLRCVADDQFALVFECNGVQLRMQKLERFEPQPFTSLGWQVADIGTQVDQLTAGGVKFQRYPFLQQDERGIWRSPSGAHVAWFKDPDGNLLSLTELSTS